MILNYQNKSVRACHLESSRETRTILNSLKSIFSKWLFMAGCMLLGFQIYAQQSAVQLTTQFIPPYSLKLSDYNTAANEKLFVQLLLTDITDVNRSVRLRMYIEGKGVAIRTIDFPMGETPLFLDGGFPLRLSNIDVGYLFSLENLQGISPDTYNKSLPEGLYQFCFEVYDAVTNVRLSQKSCTPLFLVQNDPPILNLPNRGELVSQKDVQNIIFQWTPRHLNATNVEYEFTLKELWDNYADPQASFLSSAPLYQVTSYAPTLLYGPGEPQLLPNKRYAWQVRAISRTGISENSVFKNNGYSEIFHFIYSADCNVPQFLLSEAQSITKVKVMWQADSDQTKFNVQYRKKDVKDAVWFERPVQNAQETNLYNLQADTTYEFRVGSNCIVDIASTEVLYTYSGIQEFKTPKKGENSSYNCGYVPNIEITNAEPIENLGVNEVFTAGDFPVTVKEINLENSGGFTGWGYIVVPYLADTKIKVSFNNIRINTDLQLIDGVVLTTYDPTWSGIDNIQNEIDAVADATDEITNLINDIYGGNETNTSNSDDSTNTQEDNSSESNSSDSDNSNQDSTNENSSNTNEENTNEENTNENTSGNSSTDDNAQSTTGNNNVTLTAYINYNNKDYKNKEVIEVPYELGSMNKTFRIENVNDSIPITWDIYEKIDDVSVLRAFMDNEHYVNFNTVNNLPDMYILSAEYGENNVIKVIVKIVKKEFELLELTVLHQKRRLAKSGETLYLINPPTLSNDFKKVKYGIKIDKELDDKEIYPNSINWFYGSEEQYNEKGKKLVDRNLKERDNVYTTTVKAGYTEVMEKSVDVKWVNEKKQVKSFTNKIKNFLDFFKVVNEVSDAAGKVMPCNATFLENFDKNMSFQWVDFNREDSESRQILDYKRFEFIVAADNLAKLKCGKELKVSALGYNISLGEIYAQLTAGINVSIINDEIFYHEGNKFKEKLTLTQGGVKLKGEAGLKIGGGVKDDDGNLIIGLEGGGKVDITGGGRVEYPYKGNSNEIAGVLYINPLMYTFTATVKLGPLDKEFKYSDILWDVSKKKEIVYNMETGNLNEN